VNAARATSLADDTRFDGIGHAALREMLLYARRQQRAVSADDAAEALGVHRNVARSRLERLAMAGLLQVSFERRSGRSGPGAGRPAKLYGVPPELAALEFPPRQLELLVGLLIASLPKARRQTALRRAGEEFGRRLGAAAGIAARPGLVQGLAELCAALGRLGWQVSPLVVAEDGAELATPTCPLRPLVLADAAAAEIDRGMWLGLVRSALRDGPTLEARCETAGCADERASCRIALRLRESDSPGAPRSQART
jgi:predicted ArsR family transcriptional regulator